MLRLSLVHGEMVGPCSPFYQSELELMVGQVQVKQLSRHCCLYVCRCAVSTKWETEDKVINALQDQLFGWCINWQQSTWAPWPNSCIMVRRPANSHRCNSTPLLSS